VLPTVWGDSQESWMLGSGRASEEGQEPFETDGSYLPPLRLSQVI